MKCDNCINKNKMKWEGADLSHIIFCDFNHWEPMEEVEFYEDADNDPWGDCPDWEAKDG